MIDPSSNQWPVWIRVVWQVIAVVVLVMQVPASTYVDKDGIVRGKGWLYTLRPPVDDYVNDFFQEWSSARNWHSARPIYESQRTTIPDYLGVELGPSRKLNLEYNAHPPSSVLMVLPLGRLSFLDALVAWHWISLAGLMLSAILFIRETNLRPRLAWCWWILPVFALLALCNPWRQQFNQGQLNGVLLLLLVLAWIAGRRNGWAWAGALIGIAAAIKIFPGFLLLYLLLRKQYRGVVVGLATLAFVTLVTMAVFGTQTYRDYVTLVLPALKEFRCSWMNHSVVGFWHRLFVGSPSEHVEPILHSPLIAWGMTGISALAVIAVVSLRALRATTAGQHDRVFWLFVTAMLLLGPLSWDHSLLLLRSGMYFLMRDLSLKLPPASMAGWVLIGILLVFSQSPRAKFDSMIAAGIISEPAGPLTLLLVVSIPFYLLLILFLMQLRTVAVETDRKSAQL